jgi:ribosomal-protein-alanine N-acetyltransferase
MREASHADVASMTAIDALCFASEDRYARGLMEDIVRGKFAVETVDRVATILVSVGGKSTGGGTVLGFITVARDRGSGLIVTLDVHPAWRRRGVGAMLLRAGEKRLTEWAVKRVILTVGRKNEGALRLYKRAGYTFFEKIPNYYESGDDALALYRDL